MSLIPHGGTADQLLALRQGEVKVLGVFAEKRMPSFPDTPTLGELGYYGKWYINAEDTAKLIQQRYELCVDEVARLW